eukprot:TRINITY_DN43053_c0_g1_i1.p1 TRINITY_DN43053_c0_g1~~TRINITY_DN43053_c0_g1_i1.p1  ORF type:complete len:308 (+),score=42.46 TRINITY_DN43053_c0_g1_i1:71-994(+)
MAHRVPLLNYFEATGAAGIASWRAVVPEGRVSPAFDNVAVGFAILGMTAIAATIGLAGWEESMALITVALSNSAPWQRALLLFFLVSAVLSCLVPIVVFSFLFQGELLPLTGGAFFGWSRGVLYSIVYEIIMLFVLAAVSDSNLNRRMRRHYLKTWRGGERIVLRASVVAREGEEGWKLGVLLGFLPAPALVKDSVATLVLCMPAMRLVILRLPSAFFYAIAFAHFGEKSASFAQHAASHGLVAEGLPISGAELTFAAAVSMFLAMAAMNANRFLGPDIAENDRSLEVISECQRLVGDEDSDRPCLL